MPIARDNSNWKCPFANRHSHLSCFDHKIITNPLGICGYSEVGEQEPIWTDELGNHYACFLHVRLMPVITVMSSQVQPRGMMSVLFARRSRGS